MTQYRVKTPAFVPGFINAMDALLKDDFQAYSQYAFPPVNILEHESQFEVVMNAPGLSKEDFKIALDKNEMIISYEKAETKEEESPKFVKKEFSMKSFKRSFTLNDDLNTDEISAKYENGLLSVSIPKKEPKTQATKTVVIN